MSDRLSEIFKRQLFLQHELIDDNYPDSLTDDEKEEHFIHTVLVLFRELSEVLNELNFKKHVKEKKKVNKEHVLEEIVDCFKYLLNLLIIFGYNDKEFVDKFHQKSNDVENKLLKKNYENR